jgi:hypothetical protein
MGFVKTVTTDEVTDDGLIFSSDQEAEFVICKNPDKLKRLLSCLQEGKHVHYVSDGDWSTNDLVMELLKLYKPAELFITTYALRELPVRQIILAQERKEILSVHMLIDYRAKARTPEVFQLAEMNINRIYLTNIHAKVTVLRSEAGCVTIVGSANWTQNPRIECGIISLNRSVADFHIGWIEKVMSNGEIFA